MGSDLKDKLCKQFRMWHSSAVLGWGRGLAGVRKIKYIMVNSHREYHLFNLGLHPQLAHLLISALTPTAAIPAWLPALSSYTICLKQAFNLLLTSSSLPFSFLISTNNVVIPSTEQVRSLGSFWPVPLPLTLHLIICHFSDSSFTVSLAFLLSLPVTVACHHSVSF